MARAILIEETRNGRKSVCRTYDRPCEDNGSVASPVVYGSYTKDKFGYQVLPEDISPGLKSDFIHDVAVMDCLIRADRWLERYSPDEMMTVVHEDGPSAKPRIKRSVLICERSAAEDTRLRALYEVRWPSTSPHDRHGSFCRRKRVRDPFSWLIFAPSFYAVHKATLLSRSRIGSGASSAAWTISGSAAGWSLAALSIARAKVFATVRPS